MGFLKKLFKKVGKVAKKIFKGVKKVFSKVVDTAKSILKSPIGQIALLAGAIYVGGVALGQWQGPQWMSGIQGSLAGPTAAGEMATAAAAEAAVPLEAFGGAGAAVAESSTALGAFGGAGPTISGAGQTIAESGGFLGKTGDFLKKGVGLIEKYPTTAKIVGGAVGQAFTPDEIDILREKTAQELALLDGLKKRSSMPRITPPHLTTPLQAPGGIINDPQSGNQATLPYPYQRRS